MPNKTFKLLISEYIIEKYGKFESYLHDAELELKFNKNYTSFDVTNLQLVKCQFETFKEIASDIMIITHVSDDDIVEFYRKYKESCVDD